MHQANSEHANNPLEDQWAVCSGSLRGPSYKGADTGPKLSKPSKEILETGPQGAVQLIQSMDEAIDTLFPFSDIYQAGS